MKRTLKISTIVFMLLVAPISSAHAQYVYGGNQISLVPIIKTGGVQQTGQHMPHKSPSNQDVPVDVYFDTETKILCFVSNDADVSFIYNIKDTLGNILLSSQVYMESGNVVTIDVATLNLNVFSIEIEIGDTIYEGVFEIEQD